jgi:phosphatidylglycerophosphate synthase
LRWSASRPPLAWQAAGPVQPPQMVAVPEGTVFDVSSPAARRGASWRLLQLSGKPTDGWLARHVHRRISRICSYVLLHAGCSPNQATFLTLAIGLASALLMAQTSHATMIAGAFLFWFASIADGIDGEMARLTLSESASGEALDTLVDHTTHLCCYAGVMIGWWRQGIGGAGAIAAVSIAAALPATLLWAMHLVRTASRTDRLFVDTKPIEFAVIDAGRRTGAWPLRAAAWVFVLFRREAFSLTFFLVALVTGWRGIYPALVGGGLIVVLATLVGYRAALDAALRARVARLSAS